jgi:hypothetical protein
MRAFGDEVQKVTEGLRGRNIMSGERGRASLASWLRMMRLRRMDGPGEWSRAECGGAGRAPTFPRDVWVDGRWPPFRVRGESPEGRKGWVERRGERRRRTD